MHIEPDIAVRLVFTDFATNLFIEDFRTASGHAAEPGFNHLLQNPLNRLFGNKAEPTDFNRSPRFDMNLRAGFVDYANDVQVPVEILLVMQTPDHMNFSRSGCAAFENSIS